MHRGIHIAITGQKTCFGTHSQDYASLVLDYLPSSLREEMTRPIAFNRRKEPSCIINTFLQLSWAYYPQCTCAAEIPLP